MAKQRNLDHLKSQVRKKPAYDGDHLDLVRAQKCLVSQRFGCVAHHVRECFPNRTMGVRISDYLAVPLTPELHDDLHKTNNESWWWNKADPVTWLRWFLPRHYPKGTNPAADEALAMVLEQIRKNLGA